MQDLCSELAHLQLRGWLPTITVCQVASAELRIGLTLELIKSFTRFQEVIITTISLRGMIHKLWMRVWSWVQFSACGGAPLQPQAD